MNVQQQVVISALLALASGLTLAESKSGKAEPQVSCRAFGGISEQVCPTSFIKLLARPEVFSERMIAVQGWPKQVNGRFYLFFDKGAADDNMVENALVCTSGCDRLVSRIGTKTTLIGKFSTRILRNDLFTPVGSIEVRLIREID